LCASAEESYDEVLVLRHSDVKVPPRGVVPKVLSAIFGGIRTSGSCILIPNYPNLERSAGNLN